MLLSTEGGFLRREGGFLTRGGGFLRSCLLVRRTGGGRFFRSGGGWLLKKKGGGSQEPVEAFKETKKGLVGGSLGIFHFKSRRAILKVFNLWAL